MSVLVRVVVLCLLALPHGVLAHEVYVLSPETIAQDLAAPSPNPFNSFYTNTFQFFFWGFLAFVLVTTVFFASITHRLEVFFARYLNPLRPWAPLVARVTLGACLLFSAYNHALFGPELPLAQLQHFGLVVYWGLWLSGLLILLGIFPRVAAVVALCIIGVGILQWGSYMLNYANYLGEVAVVLLLGATFTTKSLEPYAFLILRVCFGISVAFASIYAKFVHSNLALSTISQYHLTQFFPFDPLFIVLGACIIEVLMGIFFIIGFEVRHTALFFLFWIFLSLLYFGESVWPHLILVGVNAALFMYGYDHLSVEGRYFNRGKLQPFL